MRSPRRSPPCGWDGPARSGQPASSPPWPAVPLAACSSWTSCPALLGVLVLPYSWLGAVWSGAPGGVGLVPGSAGICTGRSSPATDAVALGLLAVAAAITAYALRPRLRSVVPDSGWAGRPAVLVGLTAAAGARGRSCPATTLLLGLLLTTAVAVASVGAVRTTIARHPGRALHRRRARRLAHHRVVHTGRARGPQWSPRPWSAWFGVSRTWRILGWCAAVAAAVATVTAAGLAADLPLRSDRVRGDRRSAALALGLGRRAAARPGRRRRSPCRPVPTWPRSWPLAFADTAAYAAAVGTVWGVVVAVRALAPATGRAARLGLAAAAAAWEVLAWWLLLVARDVAVIEAYTLPLAAVALLAGWAALRARPGLSSWVAYGPALAAAFLPSLATHASRSPSPCRPRRRPAWRRLLLGLGGLAVVVGGSVRRRQAPVMVGGAVLALVALHETVLIWDLVPRWVPLALGGLLLVGLAMTYERRRRDMARLRTAIGRMT